MTFETTRRKQVLVLQPKGKALYEDDSSFGSKMLAKMGWNKGSGLGKAQHGSLDFIQIRYKNNANGLGYDGLKDNQWTENESQFDNLLKSLNGNSDPNSNSGSADEQQEQPSKSKSLEEKSKLSRARVHYKKFTKGKDVHRYSEKDLANILGKKTLVETEEVKEEEVEIIEEDKPNVYDSNLIFNTGLSVTDYFKQKMLAKTKKNETNGSSDNGDDKKKKLQQESGEETCEVDYKEEPVEVPAETSEKKKKKKKRKLDEETSVAQEIETVQDETEDPPTKKKKKSKKVIEEPEVEPEVEPVVIEESSEKPKTKKKAKNDQQDESEPIEEPKSSKKSKKDKSVDASAQKPSIEAGEPERPRGANAVYSTNVITIPSHIAQKMASVVVDRFKFSNIANIVGYGLSEDIEMKVVQTKIGDNINNSTDKYSLYNMDRMTRERVNPRRIMSKIKRTKKSIQVI